jgi:hypothetical protein
MPPELHAPSEPPKDMPPSFPGDASPEHTASHESHDQPTTQVKKPSNVPTPPKFGENPREILKADIQAQNPGKKPHEINALVKQHLETQHAGKSPAEINQALKEHYEGQHPGKTHAEILEAVKAGGGHGLPESPTVTPSKTVGDLSPQEEKRKSMTGSKPQGNMMDALSSLGDNPTARLKKVDPEAEAKRKAAAEEKLKNNPKVKPSGDMLSELKEQMAKRSSSMNPDKKVESHQDFEQNWDDND